DGPRPWRLWGSPRTGEASTSRGARAFLVFGRERLAVISPFDARAILPGILRAAVEVGHALIPGWTRILGFLSAWPGETWRGSRSRNRRAVGSTNILDFLT